MGDTTLKLTADISLYPLLDNYIAAIDEVILAFNQYDGIDVVTNATATQLFGDYDRVMEVVNIEMRRSFEKWGRAVFVVKFIGRDTRELLVSQADG